MRKSKYTEEQIAYTLRQVVEVRMGGTHDRLCMGESFLFTPGSFLSQLKRRFCPKPTSPQGETRGGEAVIVATCHSTIMRRP